MAGNRPQWNDMRRGTVQVNANAIDSCCHQRRLSHISTDHAMQQ